MGILNCKKSNNNTMDVSGAKSQLYYQSSNNSALSEDISSPKESIELLLSLCDVDNSLYSIELVQSDDDFRTTNLLGRTNEKQGTNFTFDTTIILDYHFEKKQRLKFNIRNINSYGGVLTLESTVASIMGAKGQTVKIPLKSNSSSLLIVKGSTIKNNNINLNMELAINTQSIGHCEPFFILKRKILVDNTSHLRLERDLNLAGPGQNVSSQASVASIATWIALYKSEISVQRDFEYSKFKMASIPVFLLSKDQNYQNSEIMIELHDNYNRKVLGTAIVTIDQLLVKNSTFVLKSENNFAEFLVRVNCNIERKYKFLDYLRGGLQIALVVGIDFTASNGNPNQSNSLHYISNYENAYERAIRACATTVAYYDNDQLFPVFGYGGVLPNEMNVNHCFNVNFKNDPNVQFVDGIINAYRNAIRAVRLYGPTFFAPIIRQAINICRSESNNYVYQILMILTDGVINDMQETINALVEASYLPMSVIIVGIGNNDFSNMDVLDADTEPLYNSNGVKAQRDLVQFVPFFKFQNNEKKLAEEVLEEVPRQVEEYFKINKQVPRDPIIDGI